MSLKIASINVEGGNHIRTVVEFIQRERPDVVCLQEVRREDPWRFSPVLGEANEYSYYVPVNSHSPQYEQIGIAILSRYPLMNRRTCGYTGLDETPRETRKGCIDEMILFATVNDGSTNYRIGTTHVRVTKLGRPTPAQMRSIRDLTVTALNEARMHNGLLLTGDFNAPRGRKAFRHIAEKFIDGVPPEHTTSLDPKLHRIGHKNLKRMVDGLFHTPHYTLSNVRLHEGVSDHKALTCTLTSLNP